MGILDTLANAASKPEKKIAWTNTSDGLPEAWLSGCDEISCAVLIRVNYVPYTAVLVGKKNGGLTEILHWRLLGHDGTTFDLWDVDEWCEIPFERCEPQDSPRADSDDEPEGTLIAKSMHISHDQNHSFGTSEGDLSSQYNLGVKYLHGLDGVSRDLEMAYKTFRYAAERGHTRAQYNLAVMYNTGTHVAKDQTSAAAWFGKAAEKGHADAAFNLAHLFLTGSGVDQDHQQAHLYLCCAADNGHSAALEYVHEFLASRGLDKNGVPIK